MCGVVCLLDIHPPTRSAHGYPVGDVIVGLSIKVHSHVANFPSNAGELGLLVAIMGSRTLTIQALIHATSYYYVG
jgi:hypothetical protein